MQMQMQMHMHMHMHMYMHMYVCMQTLGAAHRALHHLRVRLPEDGVGLIACHVLELGSHRVEAIQAHRPRRAHDAWRLEALQNLGVTRD